jgi:glycosyltransferase involved in cell wall biosynthesis
MREVGARAYVIADEVDDGYSDPCVVSLPSWQEGHGPLRRFVMKLGLRLAPTAVDLKLTSTLLLSTISRLHRDAGLQVFEMEEAHGTVGELAKRSCVPVVVRLHGPWFTTGFMVKGVTRSDFEARVRRERKAIQRAAGVSAVSQDVLARVRSFYGLDLPDATVVPNPVEPVGRDQQWSPTTCDPNRLLFVGRFDRHKGADVLIKSFAQVLRQRPQTKLTFVGPDPGLLDDTRRAWTLPQFVQQHLPEPWMQAQFEWLGPRSRSEVLTLRRAAFATVVSSRYETFSLTTLEAMAAGCPLVAADVGGIHEIVHHERNGLLFRAGDAEDLAKKLLLMMGHRGMAESLGRQAAVHTSENYSPVEIARRTLAFYREVLERRHSRMGMH